MNAFILKVFQIIIRARQNYLFDRFRAETSSASLALIDHLREAWRTYVQEKVTKGLLDSDRPTPGQQEKVWPRLLELFQSPKWKQECLKRDEKFDMHFSNAVSPQHVKTDIDSWICTEQNACCPRCR